MSQHDSMNDSKTSLLRRCAVRPSIGVAVDAERIAVSVMATTPLGRRHVFGHVQMCDGNTPQAVLERLLYPWVSKPKGGNSGARPWVRIGVPEAQVFQAVVPVTHANKNAPPSAFFLEAVQATNVRAEERIIDLLRLELNKQPLACVAAAPRAVVESLIASVTELGARIGLAEPTPAALYRAAAACLKPPRGSQLCVRFLLGDRQAIGVLAYAALPVFWHTFDLTPGEETQSILAAYSTLWMMGRHCRITLPVDTVIIHGRAEVAFGQEPETFRKRTGARLLRCARPNYDLGATAMGLALVQRLGDYTGLDLARSLKPAPSIGYIFPWGELAIQGALVGAVSLFLMGTASRADVQLKAVGVELKTFSWLKDQNQTKLDAEKHALRERFKAIDSFRKSRVAWSVPLRKIAGAAPESTIITALAGDSSVETMSRSSSGKKKKQLIINFATPMAGDGALPHEIDGFIAALRAEPTLKRHFPLIEVSGLRASPARRNSRPFASYSVVCLPRADLTKNVAAR
jgi:hypothetical protein